MQHLTTEDYCVGALSEAKKYSQGYSSPVT